MTTRKDETSVDNDARRTDENNQLSFLVFFRSGPGKGQRPRQRPELRPKPKPRTELSIIKKHINDIKIINLSAKQLSDLEISLLDKGLKFTPTPPTGNV